MRRLYGWILRCLRWAVLRPWPLWVGVGGVAIAWLFVWFIPWHDAESRMRWAGTALQLAGLLLTVIGIIQTRNVFHLPSLLSILRGWFADRPKWRTDTRMELGPGVMTMRGGDLLAQVRPGADSTVDEKIALLFEQLGRLEQIVSVGLREVADVAAGQLAEERGARIAEDAALGQRLKLSVTGGLNLSAVGLIWLVVGTVFAGFAPELAATLTGAAAGCS